MGIFKMKSSIHWAEYKRSFSISKSFLLLILANILLLASIVAGVSVLNAEIGNAFQKLPEVPDFEKELSLGEMQILQSQFEDSIGRAEQLFWIAGVSAFILITLFTAAILLLLFQPKKFILRFIILNIFWYAAWALLVAAVFRYTSQQQILSIILGGVFLYTTPIFSVLSTKEKIPFKKTFSLAITRFPSLIQPFLFAALTLIISLGILLLLYFAPPLIYSIATTASLVLYLAWAERFVLLRLAALIKKP